MCNAQTSGTTPYTPGVCVTDGDGTTRTCQPIPSCTIETVGGVLAPLTPPPPDPPPAPPMIPPPTFTASAHGTSARIAAIDNFASYIQTSQNLAGSISIGASTQAGWSYTVSLGAQSPAVPANPATTLYRWASVSKTLTGVVAAMLAADGVVDLDTDITTYYPGYTVPSTYLTCADGKAVAAAYADVGVTGYVNVDCRTQVAIPSSKRVITLRLLLGHRAGLQYWNNGYLGTASQPGPLPSVDRMDPAKNTGMEWAFSVWATNPLVAIPGDYYSYSNAGINLAAVVLEKATGQSFASLVQQRIASPLSLCSLQPDYGWVSLPDRAHGYKTDNNGRWVNIPHGDDISWCLAAGGFVSTIDDFVRYGQALMSDNTWLTPTVRAILWADHGASYATTASSDYSQYSMGFSQAWSGGTLQYFGHNGLWQGNTRQTDTHFWHYPSYSGTGGPCVRLPSRPCSIATLLCNP